MSHNGITYVILDGSSYVLETGPRKGSWKPISPTYFEEGENHREHAEAAVSPHRAPPLFRGMGVGRSQLNDQLFLFSPVPE